MADTDLTDSRARMTGTVPPSKILTTEIPRYVEDYSTRLLSIPDVASAVADALDELGIGAAITATDLPPVAADARMCGPAVTLRYVPLGGDVTGNRETGRGTTFGDRDLYGLGRPGDVAVMDCSGSRSGAVMGALSARWAVKAEIAGCVVDGAIRDTASILASGLPVWSATRNPAAARYRYETVQMNGQVSLFGHLVNPGDYIVADIDGVCVIPFFDVPRVVEHCENAHRTEVAFIDRIDAAATLEELVAGLTPGTAPA
ncbi:MULTISPECIES: RraA family protein [unclassified Rhodococcus (in: high G+C Gram-positive bacteria)]|uniref:RraA family protein n=1 Tax=unclassified Rhodococcus (in: high G+C Gram-positive bacteria) TaxID=192944 RepID=UPI0002D4152C|nr:RraA family protein [Rhodococcus sp. DK17]